MLGGALLGLAVIAGLFPFNNESTRSGQLPTTTHPTPSEPGEMATQAVSSYFDALGEADAGFVYATDVRSAEEDILSIELPAEAQPTVEYTIAVVSESERKTEAQDFIDLVLSDEGVEALEAAGFGTP